MKSYRRQQTYVCSSKMMLSFQSQTLRLLHLPALLLQDTHDSTYQTILFFLSTMPFEIQL